ncbi:MAG: sulfotransferase [Actinomycetota bacterium]|nr:sulfotransferase [Actinomycetota bacterium]
MLGEVPGMTSLGELDNLWIRGLTENDLCGCGCRFRECPFWAEVGQRAFGGWDRLNGRKMVELERDVARHRYIPFLIEPSLSRGHAESLRRFSMYLTRLYRTISDVSGARIVVDSSKHAAYAFLLRLIPGISLRVVHMVRDSHGVAYSWTKKVRRPEAGGEDIYMARYHPARMAARWSAYNLLFEMLPSMGVPTMTLRYEDLVASPRPSMERILRFSELPVTDEALSFLSDGTVELGKSHTVSGNPMRFKSGSLELRPDVEWREKMQRKDRRVVSALTWPLLMRYGYGVRAGS